MINFNVSCAKEINIKRGVKQGCPLSLILFNLFIDPIFKYIKTRFKGKYYNRKNYE
jgi:hypothetical protein